MRFSSYAKNADLITELLLIQTVPLITHPGADWGGKGAQSRREGWEARSGRKTIGLWGQVAIALFPTWANTPVA